MSSTWTGTFRALQRKGMSLSPQDKTRILALLIARTSRRTNTISRICASLELTNYLQMPIFTILKPRERDNTIRKLQPNLDRGKSHPISCKMSAPTEIASASRVTRNILVIITMWVM